MNWKIAVIFALRFLAKYFPSLSRFLRSPKKNVLFLLVLILLGLSIATIVGIDKSIQDFLPLFFLLANKLFSMNLFASL